MSVTFDLPDIKCKYLIDENEYSSLTDLLQKPFEPSKVGKKEGDYHLPEVRSGKFRNTKIVFENQKELNSLILSQLEEFSWLHSYKEYLDFDINNDYQVLKYEENDFFNRHQDNISDIRHFGTLLIFPPAIGELEHQGGKLVLDEINDEFDSSSNTSWKAIILFCEIFHEIEKVTSGQRVVFKTKLLFNEEYDSDIEQDINSNVMDVGMSDYAW